LGVKTCEDIENHSGRRAHKRVSTGVAEHFILVNPQSVSLVNLGDQWIVGSV